MFSTVTAVDVGSRLVLVSSACRHAASGPGRSHDGAVFTGPRRRQVSTAHRPMPSHPGTGWGQLGRVALHDAGLHARGMGQDMAGAVRTVRILMCRGKETWRSSCYLSGLTRLLSVLARGSCQPVVDRRPIRGLNQELPIRITRQDNVHTGIQ